jgi:RNA polymerase sigma-70 factor, ECF subfamily
VEHSKDRSEAEEAVQDGYMKAFNAIQSFAGASSLSTWLTRIVVNEALGRRRNAQKRSGCSIKNRLSSWRNIEKS